VRNFASLLIGLVICAQSWAQITVAPVTPQGRKIPAFFATEAPKDAKVKFVYETSKNADFVDLGGGHLVLIGTNGEGSTINGLAIWVVDGEPFYQKDTKPFRVGDSPGPEPTPITLRELVTAEQAKQIAIYFRDFAGLVATLKSPGQFWTAFDATFKFKDNTQLYAALRKRLEGPVEAKKGLSVVLLAIAGEFDAQPVPPTPPPVTEGKRIAVIAHESADKTTAKGAMVVELRKPGTNASNYLKAKGHELYILDEKAKCMISISIACLSVLEGRLI